MEGPKVAIRRGRVVRGWWSCGFDERKKRGLGGELGVEKRGRKGERRSGTNGEEGCGWEKERC